MPNVIIPSDSDSQTSVQVHHEKELEHLKRMMDRKEEELLKNQTLERKALPKRIRQEMKAREMMFRESMRISVTNLNEVLNPSEEKDRITDEDAKEAGRLSGVWSTEKKNEAVSKDGPKSSTTSVARQVGNGL